jgi:hypothetical protein
MPAGSTYTPIATTTLGSGVSSYTFSSIPQTYTDLVLVINGTASSFLSRLMQFNSDTSPSGTNYSDTGLNGSGSSASSYRGVSAPSNGIGGVSASNSTTIVQIQNYSNTTTYKTSLWRANTSTDYVQAGVCLWRSTAAISSIVLTISSGNFGTGSTFTLYGIAAA